MNFSEKVRTLRNRFDLSQEALADKLNVSRQTISKWESGVSFPEIEKLIELSEFFNVSIDYLLKKREVNPVSTDDLDRVVFQFLGSSQKMSEISESLIDIMQDGCIDNKEKLEMERIVMTLDTISKNIDKIKNAINVSR